MSIEVARTLPEHPTFAAIYNPNATHAAKAARILETFDRAGALIGTCETMPDPNENQTNLVDFFNRMSAADAVLVLGGDGLLNATFRAQWLSDNQTTALVPGPTAGAGDALYLTLGWRPKYSPDSLAEQPVMNVTPLRISISHGNGTQEIAALLYASFGGPVGHAAEGVNTPQHRTRLRAAQQMSQFSREVVRRSAELAVVARASSAQRFIAADGAGRGRYMAADIVVINGGQIAGLIPTPGDLRNPQEFYSLRAERWHDLAYVAGRLLLGRQVAELELQEQFAFTLVHGKTAGKHGLRMQFDGETTILPVPAQVEVAPHDRTIPLVFSSQRREKPKIWHP